MKTAPIKPSRVTLFKSRLIEKWNTDSPGGSIFRNMAVLASGAGLARFIGVFSAPIITRIYLPEHMGVLSVFVALAAILAPFGTMRYSMAIPLPKHDGVAMNLVMVCVGFLLVVTALVTMLFWLFGSHLLDILSMEKLLPFWWLLPVTLAGAGMYEVLSNWAVREKAFKALAKTAIWQSMISRVVKIGLGLLGLKPLGLLVGELFARAGGILSLFSSFLWKFRATWRHVTKKRMVFLIRRYADFPKYRLPSQFLLVLAGKAPLLFFAWQYGAEVTGQLGLALTMLAIPISLFSQTTGQAYYAEIAKIGNKNPNYIYKVSKNIVKKLFFISIPFFVVLMLFGPWIFETIFGKMWREAGVFASILSVYLLAQFASNPLTNALNVFGRQDYYLKLNIFRTVVILSVFTVSYSINMTYYYTLLLYSVALALLRLYIFLRIINIIREYKKLAVSEK